jgi:hypothetical protein
MSIAFFTCLPCQSALRQISHDQAVYIDAINGDILTIQIERLLGSDPDIIYIYGPDGKLQEERQVSSSTTIDVALDSGNGTYKVLHVNYTYIHVYTTSPPRPMVVEAFDHHELFRLSDERDMVFYVPENTDAFTYHAHSMRSTDIIRQEIRDPEGNLVYTFDLQPNTWQQDQEFPQPASGFWRCTFTSSGPDRCGAWLDGVPNYFAATPSEWFEPVFPRSDTCVTATMNSTISLHAKMGCNWWINPSNTTAYEAERDAVVNNKMETARLSVDWVWREPVNDNGDPYEINWTGFDFSGHDSRMTAYYNDIVTQLPGAMPVLMFYWSDAVQWQSESPEHWTPTQQAEYAEFVLATMIHTLAPDLETPPGSHQAYDFHWIELINEPNLSMGSTNHQSYIDLVIAVGERFRQHPDPRINSVKIAAPGIGWAWGRQNQEKEDWIGKLLDQADEYVDGVNWHQYEYLRLEECHRFTEDAQTMKQWLTVRGDGFADETLLMTETNQHGGSPVYWKRQDTIYGALWWAGASFSALNSGTEMIHYYKLVDEPPPSINFKGMMFNDGPYYPPHFPGGPPHGNKPILDATGFINTHRYQTVIESSCDHPEIAQLTTMDESGGTISFLVANLFDRDMDCRFELTLPGNILNQTYTVSKFAFSDQPEEMDPHETDHVSRSNNSQLLVEHLALSPRSIQAMRIDFDPLLNLLLNDDFFHAGDPFILELQLLNKTVQMDGLILIALEAYGTYFFWPGWTETIDGEIRDMPQGTDIMEILLEFIWPGNTGSADDFAFWGALLDPVTLELYSLQRTAFGFSS